MDFQKIETILWDNKDKIPQGDYIKLCEEIQKIHNNDPKKGIKHYINIKYIVEIQIIRLTETELSEEWETNELRWEDHIEEDKPIEIEEIVICKSFSLYLNKFCCIDSCWELLYDVADKLKDNLHDRNTKNWWIYLDNEKIISELYEKVFIRRNEINEDERNGLLVYRTTPIKQMVYSITTDFL
tara:strand:+ start:50 stop:601 length:552 start_codon:yes stop_codon:yes gene_type:complete